MIRILAVLLAFAAVPAQSGSLFRNRFEIDGNGVLERTIEYSGRDLGRLEIGFDPAVQSVTLLDARVEQPGGGWQDLPAWAVDTLAGSDGFPCSFLAVFPPGRSGILRIEFRDWSWSWEDRLWLALEPPEGCDSSEIEVVRGRDLDWEGVGWASSRRGGSLLLAAGPGAGPVTVSSFESWAGMYEALSRGALDLLSGPQPPSVREAAIEASAGGADPAMLLSHLRTLVCNSVEMILPPPTMASFSPRDPGTVIRQRRATRMEAALLFAAVARAAGLEAEIVLGSTAATGLPVPGEWDRVLVRAGESGRMTLYEPSAVLVPADYIPDCDGLMLLRPGDAHPVEYTPPPSDRCRETWSRIGPGRWTLSVEAGGAYDSSVRRRLAGAGHGAARQVLAGWLWRAGIVCRIDSVLVGDLYDLSTPASFGASITIPLASPGGGCEPLPLLDWAAGGPDGFERTWAVPPGTISPRGVTAAGDILADSIPSARPLVMRAED